MFVLRDVLVIDGYTLDLGDKFCHICWVCQPIIASSKEHGGDSQLCHIVAWWCGLVCRVWRGEGEERRGGEGREEGGGGGRRGEEGEGRGERKGGEDIK